MLGNSLIFWKFRVRIPGSNAGQESGVRTKEEIQVRTAGQTAGEQEMEKMAMATAEKRAIVIQIVQQARERREPREERWRRNIAVEGKGLPPDDGDVGNIFTLFIHSLNCHSVNVFYLSQVLFRQPVLLRTVGGGLLHGTATAQSPDQQVQGHQFGKPWQS